MPFCKNDKTKKYKGDEPSPKGLGYCAHAEKNKTIKRGNDGNMWEIKSYNGTKRWVKVTNNTSNKSKVKTKTKHSNNGLGSKQVATLPVANGKYLDNNTIDCSKYVGYRQKHKNWFGSEYMTNFVGLQYRPGYIYKLDDDAPGKFFSKEMKIPEGARKFKPTYIECIDKNSMISNNSNQKSKIPKTAEKYKTLFNGGTAYLVYIYKSKSNYVVEIYKRNSYVDENFNKFVKRYTVSNKNNITIGRSRKLKNGKYNGEYDNKYNGNTILLYLGQTNKKHNYVYICAEILEFSTDYKINDYVSQIYDNSVAYAYAIDSDNNYYLFDSGVVILLSNIKNSDYDNKSYDIYDYYYNNEKLLKKKNMIKTIKSKKIDTA